MEENKNSLQDGQRTEGEKAPSYEELLREVQKLRREVEGQAGASRELVQEEVGRAMRRERGRAGRRRTLSRRCIKAQRRQFSGAGLVLTAYFAAAILVQIGVITSAVFLSGGWNSALWESPLFLWSLSVLSMYAVAFPVAAGLFTLIPKAPARGGERWGSGKLMCCMVISMGLGFLGNILGNLVSRFLTDPLESGGLEELMAGIPLILVIAVTVFVAPVAEELLFRKFLIDRIGAYGEGMAVLLSGLLFGLAHGNFSQFFYTFAIGCLWAYVYVKTGNIGYTIAFHMMFNLIGGGIVLLLANASMGAAEPGSLLWRLSKLLPFDIMPAAAGVASVALLLTVVLEAACAAAGTVLLILYRKRISFLPGREPLERGRRAAAACLNPGMLLYLAVCAGMFFLS